MCPFQIHLQVSCAEDRIISLQKQWYKLWLHSMTGWPTKTYSGPLSLALHPPPLPSLLTRQTSHHMRSHCHHCYYSVLVTTSVERGGKGLVLQSKPTSFFVSTAFAMKPHTLWGLQRKGPPARKLKCPLCLSQNLGTNSKQPFLPFLLPQPQPLLVIQSRSHLPSRRQQQWKETRQKQKENPLTQGFPKPRSQQSLRYITNKLSKTCLLYAL